MTRILGVDPGFGRMGYGVIESVGHGQWQAVAYGCLETSPKKSLIARLQELRDKIKEVVKEHKPTLASVEKLYFFNNAKTALDVGQARGVILLTLLDCGLEIYEYTPLQIKQALTGYGRAEKGQMQKMAAMVLGVKKPIKSDDAADALAGAYCAAVNL
ncbi:MAG: crossover junction endodeoxyribonuclease RuvC [Candidatus Magasanikbacteria bacterium RIFOXYC2_FULL_42_28]|uniref:Crossover junction endodeoxyribonuclease RuvC n=1 Tax=Candidatus Magasanikbacteria bacterium RIFOXYC2_FULL_42_28 TaxID=1798704 RepID=A0A1F6NX97_9BACT|nr:MAG: crossover junction endodeoxyribonuclease RuvC [Candidatus Magasanikbacteria bacterium RIFOXYC2_FULL_42_28]